MLKQKNVKIRLIFNNRGMSIIEVLVAAGLASIVALGVATMMQNMMYDQKKIQILDTLGDKKTFIESLILTQASWNFTINASSDNTGALFNGLRSNSNSTPEVSATTPVEIKLYNANGTLEMDLVGPADAVGSTTNGFAEDGSRCSNFIVPGAGATTTGNDGCPFSYRLLIASNCPGAAASCSNPELKVVARLLYNPSPNGILQRWKQLVNTDASISTDITNPTGSKFDVVIDRTAGQSDRFFTIYSGLTGGGGTYYAVPNSNCSGYGAGTCSAGAFAIHPLTVSNRWTEEVDSASLVTASAAQSYFTFNETGSYKCVITMPAFATGVLTGELYNNTTAQSVASGFEVALGWSSATVAIQTQFNVANTSDQYIIRQRRDAVPTAAAPNGDPNIGSCSLGFASTPYGTVKRIVTVTCEKQ